MRFFLILFILGFLIILSCNKKNYFPKEPLEEQLVIQAEITANDSVYIPVGSTLVAGSGNLIQFRKVYGAQVIISNNSGLLISPKQNVNSIFENNPFSIFTNNFNFESNTTYTLSVNTPSYKNILASTHIPSPIPSATIDTNYTFYAGFPVLQVRLSFTDNPTTYNDYVIEVLKQKVKVVRYFFYQNIRHDLSFLPDSLLYETLKNTPGFKLFRDSIPLLSYKLQNIYTLDQNTDNASISNLSVKFQRLFITDSSFNGPNYTTQFYVPITEFVATNANNKGRILIRIKSVSRELYKYLLDDEKYFLDFGSIPSNDLVSPKGNIINGLGIFGGSYKKEWVLYYDELL